MRDVHLRAVEASLAGELGGAAPPLDHFADVLVLHRLRRLPIGRRLHRGRAPKNPEVVRGVARRIEAEVVQLGEDQSAVLLDRRRQPTVGLERLRPIRPGHARETGGRGRVDDAVPGDQQPGTTLRASCLVGNVPFRVDCVIGPELDVGRLHDPVSHRDSAHLQRAEQVWVVSQRASSESERSRREPATSPKHAPTPGRQLTSTRGRNTSGRLRRKRRVRRLRAAHPRFRTVGDRSLCSRWLNSWPGGGRISAEDRLSPGRNSPCAVCVAHVRQVRQSAPGRRPRRRLCADPRGRTPSRRGGHHHLHHEPRTGVS